MNYDRRSVGQSVLVSSPIWGSRPDMNYYLTVTAFFFNVGRPLWREVGSVICLSHLNCFSTFSKFAAGPRQHSICLSVFITPGERVAQLYPQALGSSGTSGVPFKVKVALRLTISRSVRLGIEPHLGLMENTSTVASAYCCLGDWPQRKQQFPF
jgi:hypothetical protein